MNEMNHITWIEHFKPRLDTSDMSSALDASRDRVQEIHKVQQVREGYQATIDASASEIHRTCWLEMNF